MHWRSVGLAGGPFDAVGASDRDPIGGRSCAGSPGYRPGAKHGAAFAQPVPAASIASAVACCWQRLGYGFAQGKLLQAILNKR